MKKLSVLMLACFFLLFSCSMDNLTGFMSKMGNNVMGDYVDTESIDLIKESTTNAKTNEVKDGKTDIGKITVTGIEVNSVLSGLSEEEMDSYVNQVTSATSNEKGKEEFKKAMAAPVEDEATTSAAKGSAAVAEKALDEVLSKLDKDNAIYNTLEDLKNSMTAIKTKEEVTTGDVVALQMMTSLVESVANKAEVDASGNVTNIDIDIKSDDASKIASDALNTIKVVSAISDATSVKLGDLSDLLKSLTEDESAKKEVRATSSIDEKYVSAIQNCYKIYSKMFPNGINDNSIAILSIHKNAVDLYVGLTGDKEVSKEVANLSGTVQYMLASAFSTANRVYKTEKDNLFESAPATLNDLIDLVVDVNPWIKDNSREEAEWKMPDSIVLKDESADLKPLGDKIVMDYAMKATVKTLRAFYNTAIDSESDNLGFNNFLDKLTKVTESGIDAWDK